MKTFAYLDIQIGTRDVGRIVIELDFEKAPKACDNFLQLCETNDYKDTCFHRVIKNFMIQGGDTDHKIMRHDEYPPVGLGKGGRSIYPSNLFDDENLRAIDEPFLVCMSNKGTVNSNSSQFFINTLASPHLTGKHTVFGKVRHGKSVVREIERVSVMSTKNSDSEAWIPVKEEMVLIVNCGKWNDGDPVPCYNACYDSLGGDIYEEYPDDNEVEGLDLENPEMTYKISTVIKESASLLLKEKRLRDAFLKYKKALRYCNELIPDQDTNPEYHKKFLNLKKTIYLNLALVALQMNDYKTTIDYCGYLLEMDKDVPMTQTQTSKTFYRLGMAYRGLKNFEVALEFLQKASFLSPNDQGIKSELSVVQKLVEDEKKSVRQRFAKFFD
ncbi:hypothetical protein KL905_005314 [Ogataea polymorpha]|uniref:peptidylprolyl isomerase n=1 Tax=Ogataea polymorpha TaxID=460523 RepID=A0A1B7SDC9_9ASCO|nr:uncharacterized protein OGAPODRAFT_50832 [Ogataea polymorpha]KAG7876588.1 hypothetical protein KL937_005324 [Ogataea polymorpha]KAG7885319.1 hypothetical protein KL936_005383 [Ogataea polymorpha]KAG7887719.1 hypothetical protein KL908_005370 [Ogataea polymorpha]KAG7897267.1 hypothetical protein KL935_005338 [Ogataea polymorpha]KAG7898163.1 hypothetical protein KL907_005359 [Ogataea polymorpha]